MHSHCQCLLILPRKKLNLIWIDDLMQQFKWHHRVKYNADEHTVLLFPLTLRNKWIKLIDVLFKLDPPLVAWLVVSNTKQRVKLRNFLLASLVIVEYSWRTVIYNTRVVKIILSRDKVGNNLQKKSTGCACVVLSKRAIKKRRKY